VLSRFKIRNYPSYAVKRSFNIFANRQALVDYEEALILERRMEEFLGEAADPSKGRTTKKFTKEDREKGFRDGLILFEEVYPRWLSLVAEAQQHDLERAKLVKDEYGDLQEPPDDRLTYYRKRFLAGWPLTRIVYKGTTILARLHQYDREVEVLRSLLGQSCFRRGKRGEWYDRLALVLMNHTGGDKEENRREALAVCEEGLAHPWTHLSRYSDVTARVHSKHVCSSLSQLTSTTHCALGKRFGRASG
jgi:Fanconi-associated nuclease 1